ncbi:type II toxin-antitoxin system ParD family antitoxin [Mitsuaria sp. CC2]|uniref:type II toxin-antitoxin system ParD family antitoxin n=1 Tax=Mitsuaria sp. CC2 TaxID=3029186 RepID=UPI003B8C9E4D
MTEMIQAELGPELEAYVQQLIDSGRYSSRQEVLKEGVLLLQQQEHLKAFKALLDKGIEDSENGLGRPADEFFDELLAKTRRRPEGS